MVAVLVNILILALVAGLIWWIITLIPLPHPWGIVVQVVFAVILVVILLQMLLGAGTGLRLAEVGSPFVLASFGYPAPLYG